MSGSLEVEGAVNILLILSVLDQKHIHSSLHHQGRRGAEEKMDGSFSGSFLILLFVCAK